MHRGFSLLEFLVASSIFAGVILGGYEFLDHELRLHRHILRLTRPEAELNYRMLIVRTFLEDATRGREADPFLAQAPAVFPDLQFGQEPEDRAFSVACPIGGPVRFARDGTALRVSGAGPFQAGTVILLAGATDSGEYLWDYLRLEVVTATGVDQLLQGVSLLDRSLPDLGTLIPVELHGLAFRDGTLYWVQPSGTLSPFTDLDDFHCSQIGKLIQINWELGNIRSSFRVQP